MCTATMVTAVRTNPNPKTPSYVGGGGERTRTPLIPSEPDNALNPPPPRRSKPRDVTSRYMSSSTSSSSLSPSSNSRRCPSPLVSRTPAPSKMTPTPAPAAKRSQSAERRRPVIPHSGAPDSRIWSGGGEVPSAQKMLFTSTRSLSVSFQGESFSFQVSKAKPAPSTAVVSVSARRCTPEWRQAATPPSEKSKPIDQHRWPGRVSQPQHPICAARSLSFDDERRTGNCGSGGNVVRGVTSFATGHAGETVGDVNSLVTGSESASDDSESVSSGSSNSVFNYASGGLGHRASRGFVVPARFREEANSRLQPSSAVAARAFATASNLFVPSKKLPTDSPVSSPRGAVNVRAQVSPARGVYRAPSPGKSMISALSTPSRGISPSRARSLVLGPSILSFAADVRRGKVAENRILDAHVLRLLYNRLLQWRFVNARADIALSAQKLNAERSLYNAWLSTAKLRESVKAKITELQIMRQTLKLISILKGQMAYLEEWSLVDQAYTGALSGAIESLRASTLRLPVIGGARAEIQDVKDAICSAVDVLQAMLSPISLLSPKVEEVNSSVGELSNLTAKERALLSQCKILLSTVAALQVKQCSIRIQVVQLTRTQT